MPTFATRLRELRTSRHLTQRQMADFLHITLRQYTRFKNEGKVTTLENLIALADYFDVSLDYLVGREK